MYVIEMYLQIFIVPNRVLPKFVLPNMINITP